MPREHTPGELILMPSSHSENLRHIAKTLVTLGEYPMQNNNLIDLRSTPLPDLKLILTDLGEKPYRAEQLYEWLHQKLATDFAEMTNIPKTLRNLCQEKFTISPFRILRDQTSQDKSTRKFLFGLSDGNAIESVWMRYKHGISVCISSQVGCRMGCAFCASGIGGLVRNLTPGEMLEQCYAIMRITKERISHVVVMGSGEPLDNLTNLQTFISMLSDSKGLHISQRNITVSTCGLVPQMKQLADQKLQITLAISLHGATDDTRRKIMPIAKRYNLSELEDAIKYYFRETGRRMTLEYTLIKGINDSKEDAVKLSRLADRLHCHVNLIPVNPVKEKGWERPSDQAFRSFQNTLEKNKINVTIRREMGKDIDATCGQLRRRFLDTETGGKTSA
jgi:23S rRNA (adenine2503-C2)-methyltransferase